MKRYDECRIASGERRMGACAGCGALSVLELSNGRAEFSGIAIRGAAGFAGLLCRPGGHGVIHHIINGERSVVTFVTFGVSREKAGVFCKSLVGSRLDFYGLVAPATGRIFQNAACQPARHDANLRRDSAEPTSGCMMELPDFEMPSASDFVHMVVLYVIAGCALGFVEFTIAKVVLKGQPREARLTRKAFVLCLAANAVAWPGVLVWLALAGLLKSTMLYLEKKKRRY